MSGLIGATFLPVTPHAQVPPNVPRVGVLMTTTSAAAAHIVAAFADALREQGHVEGSNIAVEYRWAEGHPERFDELAADLVRHNVKVLVASSQGPALAAKRATMTIPIIMVNATDPVAAGLVSSLARPGGNGAASGRWRRTCVRRLISPTIPAWTAVASC